MSILNAQIIISANILSIYYVPVTIMGIRDTVRNKNRHNSFGAYKVVGGYRHYIYTYSVE